MFNLCFFYRRLAITTLAAGLLLMGCSSGNSDAEEAGKPEKDGLVSGQRIYQVKCALCHGADGSAGVAGAADLQMSEYDSVVTADIIRDGRNAMPPFKAELSAEEIRQVASYVQTLRK